MSQPKAEFNRLLSQVQQPILGYLIRLTGSLADAQDLLQASNVTAISKSDCFEIGTNFTAWMREIAINHYRNYVRRQRTRGLVPLMDDNLMELVQRRRQERIASQARQANWEQLQECMKRLSSSQQEVIRLFYMDGLSLEQIAYANVSKTANAVGQQLHRARQSLIRCVRKRTQSEEDSIDAGLEETTSFRILDTKQT